MTKVHYRLLQEHKGPQEFDSPETAGEAWCEALTRYTSEMQYLHTDGKWKTMATVGFDGHNPYKGMPFHNTPGAAEFIAAYNSAMGPDYQDPSRYSDGICF